eukprot:CAMPEP_0196997180 /NCGR_PEP_ID=MMETSP1380-20130617/2854_1 /TAXON_ID=5936 /ORGANISM="Euplotes crassus, Strain CT5" /LENGTH=264 /DNA_ID=CAMNT_0042413331 /DNA_START=15 /DNA_END=809 /DNA_ORIENTATION=-
MANKSKGSFKQPNCLYSSKSSISSSLIENNSSINFYHLPTLFEVDEFEISNCSEEDLITKSNWLCQEIKDVKNHKSELESHLSSLDQEQNELTEKLIIHIGNCTVAEPQVGKKYQISLQQRMDCMMKKTPDGADEQALEHLASLSTVHIDKSGPPDEYNKVQPSKTLAEESKVAPQKYFSLAELPVVKAFGKESFSNKNIGKINKKDFLASAIATKSQTKLDESAKHEDSLLQSSSSEKEVLYIEASKVAPAKSKSQCHWDEMH